MTEFSFYHIKSIAKYSEHRRYISNIIRRTGQSNGMHLSKLVFAVAHRLAPISFSFSFHLVSFEFSLFFPFFLLHKINHREWQFCGEQIIIFIGYWYWYRTDSVCVHTIDTILMGCHMSEPNIHVYTKDVEFRLSYLFKCYLFRVHDILGRARHMPFFQFPLRATSSRCVYGRLTVPKTRKEAAARANPYFNCAHMHIWRSLMLSPKSNT